MKNILSIIAVISVVVFAACSGSKKAVAEKPTVYNTHVLPLIQAKCTPCHLPSQKGFKANFENYASAINYGAEMLVRVQMNPGERGFMPFKHEKLPAEEIAIFKKWVDGGMLEK